MLNVFFLTLLLVYFWYFYHFDAKPLDPPSSTGPDPPPPFHLTYTPVAGHAFEFHLNGQRVWSQTVPSYVVTPDRIQEMDACHESTRNGQTLPAQGFSLYQFVQEHPHFQSLVRTQQQDDSGTTLSRLGTPFYFTCRDQKIAELTLCPPGHFFFRDKCQPFSACTGQPNGKRLPHPDPHRYIECRDEAEQVKPCVPGHVFYAGQCVSDQDRLCVLHRDLDFFRLDATTLFGCRNHAPLFKTCPPGTRLFEHSTVCEPDDCFGQPDGARVPLRIRRRASFEYVPGYAVCRQGKIDERKECPAFWDPTLARQENLTMLPMVYDPVAKMCSVPSLCDNVQPTERDVHVKVYQYTRDVQNWFYSRFHDQGKGYRCNDLGQKEAVDMPIDQRINDHFKVVPLCNENDPDRLPLSERVRSFYDCLQNRMENCPPDTFFDGSLCRPIPENPVFKYRLTTPLFHFEPMTLEGWILPFNKVAGPDRLCDPGFQYVKMYDICSDPQCVPFAFLSMIPQLSLFLPPVRGADGQTVKGQCAFDPTLRTLHKRSTTLDYSFWDQRIRHPEESAVPDTCTFKANLKTGNVIWDTTLFATCDPKLPFVFCPSPHTRQILDGSYACNPPPGKTLRHAHTDYHPYEMNAFKRVVRVHRNVAPKVRLNRGEPLVDVPEDGLAIPIGTRLNLYATAPVDLEYRYRVTYPPHVHFEYTDTGRVTVVSPNPLQTFQFRTQTFEYGKFQFPTYTVQKHVPLLTEDYHP